MSEARSGRRGKQQLMAQTESRAVAVLQRMVLLSSGVALAILYYTYNIYLLWAQKLLAWNTSFAVFAPDITALPREKVLEYEEARWTSTFASGELIKNMVYES